MNIAKDNSLLEQHINNDKKSAIKAVTVNTQLTLANIAVLRGRVNYCQRRSANSLSIFKLDPWFVTVFTDAEGFFQ